MSAARNIAAESRFYDFKLGEEAHTIEPILTKIESTAKPIFKRIIDADSLAVLTPDDRFHLSVFFAIQFVRTKAARAATDDMEQQFLALMRDRGFSDDQLRDSGFELDQYKRAVFAIKRGLEAPKAFGQSFLDNGWLLFGTPKNDPFVIGDHPMALQNTRPNDGPYGNIGLAVPGVEIYFPLTPTRALAMWCRSNGDMFRRAAMQIGVLQRRAAGSLDALQDPERICRTADALGTGDGLQCSPENIKNFNWLQVVHAESHVFSSVGEFGLVRESVAQSDDLRRGRRMQVS
ncbi:putative membrane protein [Caballeronia cordobensis]|nr:putative membrane protein [Burkholderia sp. RPE67]